MTADPETVRCSPATAARIVFGAAPDALTAIYEDDVNAAVWQRPVAHLPPPGRVARQLRDIAIEGCVPAANVTRWLAERLPDGPAALCEDVAELAAMYACLFDVDSLGLRLKTLDRAMCPRFHVDRVVCRLLTTYEGPGTEYLANEDVDRSQLGRPLADPLPLPALHDNVSVRRLPAGAVVLCKGESWPGNEGRGFVHRSPRPGACPRVMLSIDGLGGGR